MQYRRPESVFVSQGCGRRIYVLLAVTRVRGFAAVRLHASGVRSCSRDVARGSGACVWSAVIALCSLKRVIFVIVTKIRGGERPHGARATRAARSAA